MFPENNNNLLLGYAYIQSNNYQGEHQRIRSEDIRFINSLLQNKYFGRSYWWHRYRFEQRFADDFKSKLRYFFKRKGAGKQHEVRSWNIFSFRIQ